MSLKQEDEAPVKAALTVVLKANDVVVAEVKDSRLWQRVLSAINAGHSELESETDGAGNGDDPLGEESQNDTGSKPNDTVTGFAQYLGVTSDQLVGACSPSTNAPYLHLDSHCWEPMKKQLPERGALAVSPAVAAATLLVLWFKKAQLGNPTQAQAKDVLATIGLEDHNASRAIKNASWLQGRSGGQIVLNPAETSKAIKLGKCFCSKDWSPWKEAAK